MTGWLHLDPVVREQLEKDLANFPTANLDPAVLARIQKALESIATPDSKGTDIKSLAYSIVFAGVRAARLDARRVPDAQLRKNLVAVAAAAWKLDALLAQLQRSRTGERWHFALRESLPSLVEAADKEVAELAQKKQQQNARKRKGRPPTHGAKLVATVAGRAYRALCGDRHKRVIDSDAGNEDEREQGKFVLFLKEVFAALGIRASAANHARAWIA